MEQVMTLDWEALAHWLEADDEAGDALPFMQSLAPSPAPPAGPTCPWDLPAPEALPAGNPKRGRALKRICAVINIFFVTLLVVSIGAVLAPKLFGVQLRAVLTGSMVPAYPVGSLLAVKSRPFEDIKVGDDITFMRDRHQPVITHRVISKNPGDRSFVTQGVANNTPDAPVGYQNVLGKVLFGVPVLGYPFLWMDSTANKIIAFTIIVAIWIIVLLLEKMTVQRRSGDRRGKV